MGDKIQLTLEKRTIQGKKVKALRREGYVPAVIYGQNIAAQSVMAPFVETTKAYRQAGKHQPVELTLDSKKQLAMIKSADLDPVKRVLRHVAFHIVNQNETVQTEVPVIIEGTGETQAEKAGLVILAALDTVEIEALPKYLPEHVIVQGEKLHEVGDHLTVADIVALPNVTVLSEPTQVIATVYEPGALQAANELAGGGAEAEAVGDVEAEHGEGTPQNTQAEEVQPGSKRQSQSSKD